MNKGELVAFVVSAEGEVRYLPMTGENMVNEGDEDWPVWSSPIEYEVLSEAVEGRGMIEYVPFMAKGEDGEDNIIPLPDGRWGRLLELIVNEEGLLLEMPSNVIGATFANWGVAPSSRNDFFIVGPTIVVAEVVDVGETDEEDFMQYVGKSIPLEIYGEYGEFQVAMMLSMRYLEWYNGHVPESVQDQYRGEEE
tara:strand:- start:15278 stop:15859 length:582 start_codon:yes stop_codon:yes gene_type:complete